MGYEKTEMMEGHIGTLDKLLSLGNKNKSDFILYFTRLVVTLSPKSINWHYDSIAIKCGTVPRIEHYR